MTKTSSRPASALGSRPELGRFGNQDQMSFDDLTMKKGEGTMRKMVIVIKMIMMILMMMPMKKPCNSNPDVHSLAPISRQLFKFLSAAVVPMVVLVLMMMMMMMIVMMMIVIVMMLMIVMTMPMIMMIVKLMIMIIVEMKLPHT